MDSLSVVSLHHALKRDITMASIVVEQTGFYRELRCAFVELVAMEGRTGRVGIIVVPNLL